MAVGIRICPIAFGCEERSRAWPVGAKGLTLTRTTLVPTTAILFALLISAAFLAHGDPTCATGEQSVRSEEGADQSASAEPEPVADDGGSTDEAEATYVVRPGETLSGIAQSHGLAARALAEENGLRIDSLLHIGMELTLPKAAPIPEKPEPQFYVVQKGDSLWRIGRRYGTTAPVLAELNGLRLNAILPVGVRLQVSSGEGGEPASHGDGSSLVETALNYRGVRYRWGGMTTRGMDCSGLVARVLNLHGIDAPHNSRALYKIGKSVSRAHLQPGDLVFFNTTGRGISHVGLYIGEDKFIHASSKRGRVRVDVLTEGYYDRKYVGARRVE